MQGANPCLQICTLSSNKTVNGKISQCEDLLKVRMRGWCNGSTTVSKTVNESSILSPLAKLEGRCDRSTHRRERSRNDCVHGAVSQDSIGAKLMEPEKSTLMPTDVRCPESSFADIAQ